MSDPAAPGPVAATPASNAFHAGGPAPGPAPGGRVNAMRGAGDPGRQIGELSPPQRVAAARQAEILTVIGQGLAAYPYVQRRSILDHLTPSLAARGVAPDTLRGFDPTDDNLAAALGEVAAIRQRLSGA